MMLENISILEIKNVFYFILSIKELNKNITFQKSSYYYDFWRLCETEDCSDDAENTALRHRNKFYFKVYTQY